MRTSPRLCGLVLCVIAGSAAAPNVPAVDVRLCRAGVDADVPAGSKDGLATWASELLRTSNFNTLMHPDVLKRTVPEVQRQYRETTGRRCLIITYERAISMHTVGGDVTVAEIIIGLNRPDALASSLLTVDAEGRVIQHAKWSGALSKLPVDLPLEAR